MDTSTVILLMGILLLVCGSMALFLVRLTSPHLKGTAWLGSAFAAGALGAALLLDSASPLLWAILADLCLLSSFVLVHVAVLRLTKHGNIQYWRGLALIAIQMVADGLYCHHALTQRYRLATLGLVVASQTGVTALVFWRSARQQKRAPALFSACLLWLFAGFNLFRSAVLVFFHSHHQLSHALTYTAFLFYIVLALGVAFGSFWMTTATLTEELEHMASTDPLTRVYNRRVFLKWCETELLRSQRSGVPFSLLMVDLDHFKQVNDNFGHQAGDQVLVAAVEQMQDSVRGIDVLCRWGGEEFAVLLPNAPPESTHIVAERIRQNMGRVTLPSQPPPLARTAAPFRLTASIGAATYRDLDDDIAAMLQRADHALYEAKSSGRNRTLVTI